MPEQTDVPISSFPDAESITNADKVTGIQGNANKNFTFSSILAWFVNAVKSAFVPVSRTINGKTLDTNIALTASDIGAQPTITANGILKGDGAGGVSAATAGTDYQAPLAIDATPTASSTNPVQSGGVYTDVRTRVPVYGLGKNLFRNWYFVGGGTGRGVFPVNQREQSSYSGATSIFDGWTADTNTSVTLGSAGITVSLLSGSSTNIYQRVGKAPLGQSITMSILAGNGLVKVSGEMPSILPSSNQTVLTVGTSADGYRFRLYLQPAGTMYVEFRAYTTQTWVAAKLELGTEQTLAHQENGVWVLNEIPDYEKELIKCQTSTADSSDTYANKSIATEQQLAYVETGTTASRAYAVGEYFCWNGLLYRAKTAISSGESFTVGTNCEIKTIGEELTTRTVLSGQYSSSALSTVYTEGITLEYNASGTMPYYGLIVTIKRGNGNGRCVQIAIPRQDNSSDFSIRSTNNNAWTSWVKYTGIRQS